MSTDLEQHVYSIDSKKMTYKSLKQAKASLQADRKQLVEGIQIVIMQ